ncbi:MAG: hypothetical protein MI749_16090 [Desulfovibrionales bacterium]|nr:hypothetical protein [Desulfovibrionales bacterium]
MPVTINSPSIETQQALHQPAVPQAADKGTFQHWDVAQGAPPSPHMQDSEPQHCYKSLEQYSIAKVSEKSLPRIEGKDSPQCLETVQGYPSHHPDMPQECSLASSDNLPHHGQDTHPSSLQETVPQQPSCSAPVRSTPSSQTSPDAEHPQSVAADGSQQTENAPQDIAHLAQKPEWKSHGSHTIGQLTLQPVSQELGEEFIEVTEFWAVANKFGKPMVPLMGALLGEEGITALLDKQSPVYSKTGAPLTESCASIAATQISHGGKKELTANMVTMNGKEVGIAMQGPRMQDMPHLLEAVLDNDVGLIVSLVSEKDRDKIMAREANLPEGQPSAMPFDWSIVDEDMKFGEYKLQVVRADDDADDLDMYYDENEMFHGHFVVSDANNRSRDLYILGKENWKDGRDLPLQEFHSLVATAVEKRSDCGGRMMINCKAGLGRTGTLMTGMSMFDAAFHHELDGNNIGAEVLERIAQGRCCRNYQFVQKASQALMLLDYGDALADALKH